MLSQVVERWQARAIWVVSRADPDYPRRLKARLREDAPAVLYGCGNLALLESGGLAVVGSRQVDEALVDYTMTVGKLCARARKTLVSGGAKGIDQAAMRGALEVGGNVCGVLADSLDKTAMNRDHRNLLMDGCLVLVSPYDPYAGFNVGNAMQRNKVIYALADAALVVNSDAKKGGTWAGAVEQLDKWRLVPVYVRSTGELGEGLQALAQKGALPWPNPEDAEAFKQVFNAKAVQLVQASGELNVAPASTIGESAPPQETPAALAETPAAAQAPQESANAESAHPLAEVLFITVREVLKQLLKTPMKEAEIATALRIATPQAKDWLRRLVDEGMLEKRTKPTGYVVKQPGLFDLN